MINLRKEDLNTISSRELYLYTKDHFSKDLKKISSTCISPIIAVRKVVKVAMDKYIKDYCTDNNNPFSGGDFQKVSNKIRDEIMKGES